MRLGGNTILITGGGTGIGLSLAKAFVDHGSEVAICGRRQEKLDEACRAVPQLKAYRCDVSLADDRAQLFDSLQRDGLHVNVLINNAANMRHFDLRHPERIDHAALQSDLNANLLAPIELTNLFLPTLRTKPGATIINISSPGGVVPVAHFPIYCASKAALNSYTRTLRHQLAGEVSVVLILPPSVETAMMQQVDLKKVSAEEFTKEAIAGLVRGREEIWVGEAKILRFLERVAPRWTFRLVNRSTKLT